MLDKEYIEEHSLEIITCTLSVASMCAISVAIKNQRANNEILQKISKDVAKTASVLSTNLEEIYKINASIDKGNEMMFELIKSDKQMYKRYQEILSGKGETT